MNRAEIDLIKSALRDIECYETKRMEHFPRFNTEKYPEYGKHIDAIIAAEDRENSSVHFSSRKLIAILIAAALLLSTAVIVFAYHEPIFSFFEEIFEKYTRYSAVEDNQIIEYIEEGIYVPKYLPNGFVQTELIKKESFIQTVWTRGTERIILKQRILHNNSITLDNENATYKKLALNDNVFNYFAKNNLNQLLWSNSKYSFTLWCTSGISKEEAIKIAQSLTVSSLKE